MQTASWVIVEKATGRAVWTMADYDAALMEYDRLRPFDLLPWRIS